jgi:transposase InsO family protein
VRVIKTPFRAPNAKAFAERWVATVRSECLDWTLIRGRRHLERSLHTYIRHYNEARPHGGLGLRPAVGAEIRPESDPMITEVRRRDLLGGLIHEYEAAA